MSGTVLKNMLAVTIGVGELHARLAKDAAARIARHTGLPVRVLGEAEFRRAGVQHPHWLRFRLFDLVEAESLLFFDPDLFCLRPWDPRPLMGRREFVAVRAWWFDPRYRPLGERFGYGDAIVNTGLFLCNRSHHAGLLRTAESLQPADSRFGEVVNFDEVALSAALVREGVPLRLLDRRFNWVQCGHGTLWRGAGVVLAHACHDGLRPHYLEPGFLDESPSAEVEHDEAIWAGLAGRDWLYERVGHDRRPLRLRADGTVGTGGGDAERYWYAVREQGRPRLVLGSALDETCTLSPCEDGAWRGRWSAHERMPVVLSLLDTETEGEDR